MRYDNTQSLLNDDFDFCCIVRFSVIKILDKDKY